MANYVVGIVEEVRKKGKLIQNFNLVFGGDIPNGAGLSSSAAIENCIVFGLNELFDLGLSKQEMILISQKAEHNYVGVKCGIMDQYASMFGEENKAFFLDCRTIKSTSYLINFKDYDLLLINTNVKHSLSDSRYNDRRSVCEKVAKLLKVHSLRDAVEADLLTLDGHVSNSDSQKALYVLQENNRVKLAANCLEKSDLVNFGKLMFKSHEGLKNLYKVSCKELDFLVNLSKEDSNVIGARMMGGGFGGCTINIVKKRYTNEYYDKVSKLYFKKFQLNASKYIVKISEGTRKV